MKWILILWALPLTLLGSWYWLSYYDINFGYLILTRQLHDLVFEIYGQVLGIPPQDIPPLVLKAVIIDSLALFSILAFRRRKKIAAAYRRWKGEGQSPEADLSIDDNLSRAP